MSFKQYDEYLYRYVETFYSAGVDEFDNSLGPGRLSVELRKYGVIKRTPKGAWIDYYQKKFVLLTARKKFACNTEEEAKTAFIARKERQKKILMAQLRQCENALRLINT